MTLIDVRGEGSVKKQEKKVCVCVLESAMKKDVGSVRDQVKRAQEHCRLQCACLPAE